MARDADEERCIHRWLEHRADGARWLRCTHCQKTTDPKSKTPEAPALLGDEAPKERE